MKIGTCLLCRYSSSRLPGKILRPLGEKPILQHIYDKLLTVIPKETVFVTTSNEASDDIIEAYCKDHGINIFRGDLKNVAGRFLAAAKANGFDYVTRINGDAPFINMGMYANMLDICRSGDYDFITNVKDRTFPIGMSAEILKTSFYEAVQPAIQANEDYKEHVTLYLYEHPEVGKRFYLFNTEYPELTGLHLAIDEEKHYQLAQRIVRALGDKYYSCTFNQFSKAIQQVKHEYELEGKAWTFTFSRDRG